jgi:hypothetical protein
MAGARHDSKHGTPCVCQDGMGIANSARIATLIGAQVLNVVDFLILSPARIGSGRICTRPPPRNSAS